MILLALAVMSFVAAAFVPGGAMDAVQDQAGALAGASPQDRSTGTARIAAATAAPGWSGGETALMRAPDGHFYAEGTVDGTPVQFLVDTGATTIALTGSDAAALGLSWNDADLKPVAQGAGGAVYGTMTTLETVAVGGREAHDVRAMIIPEGLAISLLGQSFLSTVPSVRIEGESMVLSD